MFLFNSEWEKFVVWQYTPYAPNSKFSNSDISFESISIQDVWFELRSILDSLQVANLHRSYDQFIQTSWVDYVLLSV